MQISEKYKVTFENSNVLDEVIYKPISKIATILCKSHKHKDICCISCEGITDWVSYSDLEISTVRDIKNKERKAKRKKKLFGFIPFKRAALVTLTLILSLFICSCNTKTNDNYGYKNLKPEESILTELKTVDNLIQNTSEGTHYVFLGWNACKWCQYYIPYFNDALKQNDVKEILYFTPYEIKGYKYIKDESGKNIDATYKNPEYEKLIQWLLKDDPTLEKGYLKNYEIKLNEKESVNLPWLYVPKIYKVVDGKIIGVVTTLDAHTTNSDGSVSELSETQKSLIYENILNLINLTAN